MFTEFFRRSCSARLIAAASLALSVSVAASGQTIRLVNDDAPVGGDGLTWATAYSELDDAIAEASDASSTNKWELWVASGVYRPDPDLTIPHLRNLSFTLREHVAILGGFLGSEPLTPTGKNQRNPLVHISRLSGDLLNNDNPSNTTTYLDNSYHVVVGTLVNQFASIDGFVVSDGDHIHLNAGTGETVPLPSPNPAGLAEAQVGAGMLLMGGQNQEPANVVKPGIMRIRFENNRARRGGGLFLTGAQQSNPVIANCTFKGNFAQRDGGGLYVDRSAGATFGPAPKVVNSVFHDNHAEGTVPVPGEGGALYSEGEGTVTIANCTITENTAGNGGNGGLSIVASAAASASSGSSTSATRSSGATRESR